MASDSEIARIALECLDYTLLDEEATDEDVKAFIHRANTYSPAAVCVLPIHVRIARSLLDESILLASAAGLFPEPDGDINLRTEDVKFALSEGADEIDVVLDFNAMMEGREGDVRASLNALIEAAGDAPVKVILETSCLDYTEMIDACRIALDSGASFLKSSTGRRGGCTPLVAQVLAEAASEKNGIKLSGGIRTIEDVRTHIGAIEEIWPIEMCTPDRFRIGASSLLDAIVEHL
ncbi:MAG: deoxyribose-phosphate aldolase [Candidatus Poseidoniales archaeon]|nr:MAG: deoxyribose-phosphate aldolase [Candidatus Poseidoniales archaeon]